MPIFSRSQHNTTIKSMSSIQFPVLNSLKTIKVLFLFTAILGAFLILWFSKSSVKSQFVLETKPDLPNISINPIQLTENWNDIESVNVTVTDLTDVPLQRLQFINANITYGEYMDKPILKDCPIPSARKSIFEIMKFWMNLTVTYNIPWWLSYGSLLGSFRHRDIIPYDSDVDLTIPAQYEGLIRRLSTPRQQISSYEINLITRQGECNMTQQSRLDCQGNKVTTQIDACSFCEPLARLFIHPYQRVDIFLADVKVVENELRVEDYWTYKSNQPRPLLPYLWYFPLQTCSFMGLVMLCPKESEKILRKYYEDLSPKYECVRRGWRKIKK